MAKNIYKCAVNGRFRRGNIIGLCGWKALGCNDLCGAHGNKKCKHKSKVIKNEQDNQVS